MSRAFTDLSHDPIPMLSSSQQPVTPKDTVPSSGLLWHCTNMHIHRDTHTHIIGNKLHPFFEIERESKDSQYMGLVIKIWAGVLAASVASSTGMHKVPGSIPVYARCGSTWAAEARGAGMQGHPSYLRRPTASCHGFITVHCSKWSHCPRFF